jgi:hypothetical protein
VTFDIYGASHPMVRVTDTIDVIGFNGDRCRISGKGCRDDWGPLLAPASTGLWESPFKTNWGKAMLGQRYESWSPQRRDVVFTVHVMNRQTGDPALDSNPRLWHAVYSRWRAMWSMEYESTIVYTSIDGERHLGVRLLQEPKPFATQQFEGADPHLFPYGSIVMPVAAELPYYVGESYRWEYEWNGAGDHWFRMPYFNPSQVPIFPKYQATDLAAYQFPDFSWGWEEYGRGIADGGKTVRVPFQGTLKTGENIDIDTQLDEETIRAENDSPVGNRMNGTDFEYPIMPGCGDAPEFDAAGNCTNGATVRMLNVTNPEGSRVAVELPRWYAQPFGTPLVA